MPAVGINYLTLKGGRVPRIIPYNWNRACFSGFWTRQTKSWNAIAVTFQYRESHLEIILDLLNLYSFLDCTIVEGKKHVYQLDEGWGVRRVRPTKVGEKPDLVDYSFVFKKTKEQDEDFLMTSILALGVQMRFLSFKEGPATNVKYRDLIDNIAEGYLSTKKRTTRLLHEMILRLNNEVFMVGGSSGHAISSVTNTPWHHDLELISTKEVLDNPSIKGLRTVAISSLIEKARALGGAE